MMATIKSAIALILVSTLFSSAGQIFLKLGSVKLSLDILSQLTNYSLIMGCICYAFGAATFILALKYGELTILYPVHASSYIWVSLLSTWIFETEYMNMLKWGGILIIILGIALMTRGDGK